jgi:hypothetical protein
LSATRRHAEAEVDGDRIALRALLHFSEEEVKHQELAAQAMMDVENLRRAVGHVIAGAAVEAAQHAAYRNTFLVLGMRNRQFMAHAAKVSPHGAQRIATAATTLSV